MSDARCQMPGPALADAIGIQRHPHDICRHPHILMSKLQKYHRPPRIPHFIKEGNTHCFAFKPPTGYHHSRMDAHAHHSRPKLYGIWKYSARKANTTRSHVVKSKPLDIKLNVGLPDTPRSAWRWREAKVSKASRERPPLSDVANAMTYESTQCQ